MSSAATVSIHRSQFPENVRRDLLESLRTRRINHKFHYDSVQQTQKWLALHQAYAPSRTDPNCAGIYDRGFASAVSGIASGRVHLVGLGCGGGQKDSRLLALATAQKKTVFYTPSDVSVAMVLVAREAALSVIPADHCYPLVCDLATTEDLKAVLDAQGVAQATRVITFFGMIPNFEPEAVMPRIAELLTGEDRLLFSANLAPGPDYETGVKRILPLYDNELTRDWLLVFLRDLGVDTRAGDLRFVIEDTAGNLKRVTAYYRFGQGCEISIDSERFLFDDGDSVRLFFSYRHTPGTVEALLARNGLKVMDRWITDSEEEGVFLCHRAL